MEEIRRLNVLCNGRNVGKMALYKGCIVAFEYVREWLGPSAGGPAYHF